MWQLSSFYCVWYRVQHVRLTVAEVVQKLSTFHGTKVLITMHQRALELFNPLHSVTYTFYYYYRPICCVWQAVSSVFPARLTTILRRSVYSYVFIWKYGRCFPIYACLMFSTGIHGENEVAIRRKNDVIYLYSESALPGLVSRHF
jgi:hypothetical protein